MPGLFPPRLFPRKLFPHRLFPGGGAAGGITLPTGRDDQVYLTIKQILEQLSIFEQVIIAPIGGQRWPEAFPAAIIIPPLDHENRTEPSLRLTARIVTYQLVLSTQEDAEQERARDELLVLEAYVDDALENVSYAGFTIARFSVLSRGSLDDSAHPTVRLIKTGHFAYVVETGSRPKIPSAY